MGGDGGETKQCTLDVPNTDRGLPSGMLLTKRFEGKQMVTADIEVMDANPFWSSQRFIASKKVKSLCKSIPCMYNKPGFKEACV
jgi:hypothetical protein